jgi:hypothetical protein
VLSLLSSKNAEVVRGGIHENSRISSLHTGEWFVSLDAQHVPLKKLLIATDGMTLAAGNAWELHHTEGHGPGFAELIRSFNASKK